MIAWFSPLVSRRPPARELALGDAEIGPTRAVIDTRAIEPGDLFVGLRGERVDGGRFAAERWPPARGAFWWRREHAAGLSAGGADRRPIRSRRCSASPPPGGANSMPR